MDKRDLQRSLSSLVAHLATAESLFQDANGNSPLEVGVNVDGLLMW